jgi:hypothetical protein
MHCANESWIAARFSMKENVPPVASAMACIAVASWSAPKPNVWIGEGRVAACLNEGGTRS